MNKGDIVYLYVEAYKEGFQKAHDAPSYKTRCRRANKYAGEICPEGAAALSKWQRRLTAHGRVGPDQEIGYEIALAIRELKYFDKFGGYKQRRIRQAVQPAAPSKGETVFNLYRNWVEQNDDIPADVALAYFAQCDAAAFSGARVRLRDKGYGFKQTLTGWHVEQRPALVNVKNGHSPLPGQSMNPAQIAQITAEVIRQLGLGQNDAHVSHGKNGRY